ncbi:MAG: hypothetical protein NTV70_11740 [Acidobacteria bacterium]|nr:hypothetical protein [Acidobacteriota bacterium]
MKTFNMIALAILGGQLASAGWMGEAGCDLENNQWIWSSQGCATSFWRDYYGLQYDPDSGETTLGTYPVFVQEEMSFQSSGFSTLTVRQRNQPVGLFDPNTPGVNFSSLRAYFLEFITIYAPGGPREIWVEVDWRQNQESYDAEYYFRVIDRLDGNELQVSAELEINGGYAFASHALNQDFKFWIERIRLFDKNGPLTGYYYSAGPEPGVMVGGTLWTPEPATFGLMAGCLLLLIGWHRFRAA